MSLDINNEVSYENPWTFDNKPFDSIDIGDYYIGRKYFWSFRKPPGKKRKVKQESDWKKYYGSCPELKEDLKRYGKETFSRVILSLHDTKGNCNFEETKQLFLNNVLSEALFLNNVLSEALDDGSPAYYNSNILGRYMRKDYGNFTRHLNSDT
jgi:hypothetical protein